MYEVRFCNVCNQYKRMHLVLERIKVYNYKPNQIVNFKRTIIEVFVCPDCGETYIR